MSALCIVLAPPIRSLQLVCGRQKMQVVTCGSFHSTGLAC